MKTKQLLQNAAIRLLKKQLAKQLNKEPIATDLISEDIAETVVFAIEILVRRAFSNLSVEPTSQQVEKEMTDPLMSVSHFYCHSCFFIVAAFRPLLGEIIAKP